MQGNRAQTKPRSMRNQAKGNKGLANYMGPFIANVGSHTAPLWELLKEKNELKWSPSHQVSFDKSISSETTLNYSDSAKETTLQAEKSLTDKRYQGCPPPRKKPCCFCEQSSHGYRVHI